MQMENGKIEKTMDRCEVWRLRKTKGAGEVFRQFLEMIGTLSTDNSVGTE